MCGRYIIRQQAKAIREWEKYGPPPFLDSYNMAPTHPVAIVRMQAGIPQFAMRRPRVKTLELISRAPRNDMRTLMKYLRTSITSQKLRVHVVFPRYFPFAGNRSDTGRPGA